LVNIFISHKFLTSKLNFIENKSLSLKPIHFLIVVPVLEEEKVISKTLDNLFALEKNHHNVSIVVAGTTREIKNGISKTKTEVDKYGLCHPDHKVKFYEANDIAFGDRATQLNFAIKSFLKETDSVVDIIGVFDADSLPQNKVLLEVAGLHLENPNSSFQQPALFVEAIKTHQRKLSFLMIANAYYQNTWTFISEIPLWLRYSKSSRKSSYNYMIGHGEFVPLSIYNQFPFPEMEVADGIQLGYQLSISKKQISPLKEYCKDQVPFNLFNLIQQHKRWFGGCMRISYPKTINNKKKPSFEFITGLLYSQFRWAFASPIFVALILVNILVYQNLYVSVLLLINFLLYAYMIPFITLTLSSNDKINFRAFAFMPIAIYIKSIGPQLYILSKIFFKKITYLKDER
jgi:hypothetical protein